MSVWYHYQDGASVWGLSIREPVRYASMRLRCGTVLTSRTCDGTDLLRCGIYLRACYAKPGTDLLYGARGQNTPLSLPPLVPRL
eukprot:3604577-Rhodomonas_salina.6